MPKSNSADRGNQPTRNNPIPAGRSGWESMNVPDNSKATPHADVSGPSAQPEGWQDIRPGGDPFAPAKK